MKETCYMCEKISTSEEHAPPKCIFPEKKDLPDGADLRQNLIKVPSCKEHNSSRSKDDEYLLYVLSMNIANNSVAFQQFSTKVLRSYNRRPTLMKTIIDGHKEVIAVDDKGVAFNTLMVQADMTRANNSFDQMARALYFYEFGKKFNGVCKFLHDWAAIPDKKINVVVDTPDGEKQAIDHVKEYFFGLEHKGSNPDVFRYHFEKPDENGNIALGMQFYGGSNTFIALIPDSLTSLGKERSC